MSRYDYGGWQPYVPVAERRATARRKMAKLAKKGQDIQPVEISGRIIARSFWGKGWCEHLESFGDYSNRLPRGRTYARNGSVCHLGLKKGSAEAYVSGSDIYSIKVTFQPLPKAKWNALKKQCSGKIGSLLELLQGQLSDEVMGVVTHKKNGLFPLPGEINYRCSCPDGASMCKHIAAVIYGIGARLDDQPELLFLLRGVEHQELIDTKAATANITGGKSRKNRRRTIASDSLADVFGVELDEPTEAPKPNSPKKPAKKSAKKAAKKKTTNKRKLTPFKPTPRSIALLRKKLKMTRSEFARAAFVSPQTIKLWEESPTPLNLRSKSQTTLNRLHQKTKD
jgi:uncharacterized Zn finger protein